MLFPSQMICISFGPVVCSLGNRSHIKSGDNLWVLFFSKIKYSPLVLILYIFQINSFRFFYLGCFITCRRATWYYYQTNHHILSCSVSSLSFGLKFMKKLHPSSPTWVQSVHREKDVQVYHPGVLTLKQCITPPIVWALQMSWTNFVFMHSN